MTARDDFAVIEPAPAGRITLGEGPTAYIAVVKPLKIGQLPAFARAIKPVAGQIEAMMAGGMNAGAVLALVEEHTGDVIEALHAATGAPIDVLNDSTVEQILEAVLAVLQANRDFLRGRLAAALKTAAAVATKPGAGLTP